MADASNKTEEKRTIPVEPEPPDGRDLTFVPGRNEIGWQPASDNTIPAENQAGFPSPELPSLQPADIQPRNIHNTAITQGAEAVEILDCAEKDTLISPEELFETVTWASSFDQKSILEFRCLLSRTEIKLESYEEWGWQRNTTLKAYPQAELEGMVNNYPLRITADTGSNCNLLTPGIAKELGLQVHQFREAAVKGIGKGKLAIEGFAQVKVTLGEGMAYIVDLLVGPFTTEPSLLLGMGFMVKAGIIINLMQGRLELPRGGSVPLLGLTSAGIPHERIITFPYSITVEPGANTAHSPFYIGQVNEDEDIWVQRRSQGLPTINKVGRKLVLEFTNIGAKPVKIWAKQPALKVVPRGRVANGEGYVLMGSPIYNEWQQLVLCYRPPIKEYIEARIRAQEESIPKVLEPTPPQEKPRTVTGLLKKPVDPNDTGTPKVFLARKTTITQKKPGSLSPGALHYYLNPMERNPVDAPFVRRYTHRRTKRQRRMAQTKKNRLTTWVIVQEEQGNTAIPVTKDEFSEMTNILGTTMTAKYEDLVPTEPIETLRHESMDMDAEDMEFNLALMPELPAPDTPELTVDDIMMGCEENTPEEIQELRDVVSGAMDIIIGGSNALPPEVNGVVCDIDVQGARPIAQTARRVTVHLKKLYDLLKGLVGQKLIQPSNSLWASPIVIVMKADKETIRLCIDYREVNKLTKQMAYPMPLVDDLLKNFEKSMWFCSLDNASGFWAVPMTQRAIEISAFICPLGHFEWRRMAFGLMNAPMIYQRLVDNALWGFVTLRPAGPTTGERGIIKKMTEDVFASHLSELDQGEFNGDLRSFIDDICFGSRTWHEMCVRLQQLFDRLRKAGICLGGKKLQLGQKQVKYLGHIITREGIIPNLKDRDALINLPFPRTLKGFQSFLGTINYYSRFVQNFGTMASSLYEIRHDISEEALQSGKYQQAEIAFKELKERLLSAPVLKHPDADKDWHIILYANQWSIAAVVGQMYDNLIHPVQFVSRTLKTAERNAHVVEREALALLRVIKVCHVMLIGKTLNVYSRHSTFKWFLKQDVAGTRANQIGILLNGWNLVVHKAGPGHCCLASVVAASITPPEQLDNAFDHMTPDKVKIPKELVLHAPWINEEFRGHVLTFDGGCKNKRQASFGGFVLWEIPGWGIIRMGSIYSTDGTNNESEYQACKAGMNLAIEEGVKNLVVVGDSNLVIKQLQGVMQIHSPGLLLLHNQCLALVPKFDECVFFHVRREFNAPADFLSTRAGQRESPEPELTKKLEEELKSLNLLPNVGKSKPEEPSEDGIKTEPRTFFSRRRDGRISTFSMLGRKSTKNTVWIAEMANPDDPIGVQEERFKRISEAQDMDPAISRVKNYLRKDLTNLSKEECQSLHKLSSTFELGKNDVLYKWARSVSDRGMGKMELKLVVPLSLYEEILDAHHSAVPGGHQGVSRTYKLIRTHYYWPNMFAHIQAHVLACPDCSTGKGGPRNVGESPNNGNIIASFPGQVFAFDHIGPFPKSRRGNLYLNMFTDEYTAYLAAGASPSTAAMYIMEIYESQVYRHFGASEVIRLDRGAPGLSELFRNFAAMMRMRHRATMSYRPQANGTEERKNQTFVRAIKMYAETHDDWDEFAERLILTMNCHYDTTRGETPFYLKHGWDAKLPIQAMAPLRENVISFDEPTLWRIKMQRHYTYAKEIVYQKVLKAKRKRRDQRNEDALAQNFKEGERVWLYFPKIKKGISKKLAFKWHGPFRIHRIIGEHAAELVIPNRDLNPDKDIIPPSQFFPTVHLSRLKRCYSDFDRPSTTLSAGGTGAAADYDFDEALLPEDSWEVADGTDDIWEVEAILDTRRRTTRNSKGVREYLIKWKVPGSKATWEPITHLNCGQLMAEFDRKHRMELRMGCVNWQDGPEEEDVPEGLGNRLTSNQEDETSGINQEGEFLATQEDERTTALPRRSERLAMMPKEFQ